MTNKKQYRYDLHVHSKYSKDSLMDLKTIYKIGMKKGLSGLAITDHNSFKVHQKLNKNILGDNNFFIIPGMEIKTLDFGDILALFITEPIKSRFVQEVFDEIISQNGFIIIPHPYKRRNTISNKIMDRIHALEIFNSRISMELNLKAQKMQIKKKKLFTVGSDAHISREIGMAYIELESNPENIDGFREQLENSSLKKKYFGTISKRNVHYYSVLIEKLKYFHQV
jgi:hypothetical protein